MYLWMERVDLLGLPEPVVPDGYGVRHYRTGDAADWTALQCEVREDMEVRDGTFDDEFPGGEAIRTERIFFAVGGNGRPVGTVAAWFGERGPAGPHGLVGWMAVLPDHRQRGLGTALLLRSLRTMARWHHAAYLSTATFLLPAVRMYLKAGFTPGIASEDDRRGWDQVARAVSHPALSKALASR